jgi:hypothetical protein
MLDLQKKTKIIENRELMKKGVGQKVKVMI